MKLVWVGVGDVIDLVGALMLSLIIHDKLKNPKNIFSKNANFFWVDRKSYLFFFELTSAQLR